MLHGPKAGLPLTAAPPPLPATRAALRARLVVRLNASSIRRQPQQPALGRSPLRRKHKGANRPRCSTMPRRHTSACEQQWVCQCDTGSRRHILAPLVGSWCPLGSGASGVHSTTSSGREGADRPVRDIAQPGAMSSVPPCQSVNSRRVNYDPARSDKPCRSGSAFTCI
jgi:hypothetical protein